MERPKELDQNARKHFNLRGSNVDHASPMYDLCFQNARYALELEAQIEGVIDALRCGADLIEAASRHISVGNEEWHVIRLVFEGKRDHSLPGESAPYHLHNEMNTPGRR